MLALHVNPFTVLGSDPHARNEYRLFRECRPVHWVDLPSDLDIHGEARTELSTEMNITVCFDSPVLTMLLDPAGSSRNNAEHYSWHQSDGWS